MGRQGKPDFHHLILALKTGPPHIGAAVPKVARGPNRLKAGWVNFAMGTPKNDAD